jgi:hypothetical protein
MRLRNNLAERGDGPTFVSCIGWAAPSRTDFRTFPLPRVGNRVGNHHSNSTHGLVAAALAIGYPGLVE